jgi:putative peptidoglycan lipid II flippase
MGYGSGILGLVAIKVLTPGYFASQNVKTPALIGVAVLILTQALNFIFVPYFAHAGLALAIGLGAMVNAAWLLVGLLRSDTYKPLPGWGRFVLQVLAASALLAVFLMWGNSTVPWLALKADKLQRAGLLIVFVSGAIAIYFAAVSAAGLNVRQLLRR